MTPDGEFDVRIHLKQSVPTSLDDFNSDPSAWRPALVSVAVPRGRVTSGSRIRFSPPEFFPRENFSSVPIPRLATIMMLKIQRP